MPPDDMVWAKGYDPSPLRFLAITEIMLSNSLAGTPFVSLPVLAIICFWLHRHKVLHVFLLPVLLLSLLFSMKVAKVWHEGILFFVLVFAAWLAFENQEASGPAKDRPLPPMDRAFPLFLALVLLVQIRWSIGAFQYDFRNNYSASRDVAYYIREHDLSAKTIYVSSFHSISILPYFQENIFKNHNGGHKPCFWLWSTQNSLIGNPRWRYGDGPGPIAQIRATDRTLPSWGSNFRTRRCGRAYPAMK